MTTLSLQTAKGTQIPLKDVKLNVNVVNHVARCTLEQLFTNTESDPIEAFYTFPLTGGSSVFSFEAKNGDKIVKTVLKEKDVARTEYNKAVSQGHGAYLMERVNGDVFNVSLGNVNPKSEIQITIDYVVELKTEVDYTTLRLNIPLTIMPRYSRYSFMTQEEQWNDRMINPPKVEERPYTMSISGSMMMPDGIVSIDSKTSKVKLSNMKGTSVDFNIVDLQDLNQDIIVTIERNAPKSCCMTQRAKGLELKDETFRYATMINISPNYKDIPEINPGDVHYVLLLDNSGSMQGRPLEYCKQGAKIFLLSLPTGSSFDIYFFNSYFEKFVPKGEKDLRMEAIEWIDNIQSYGGTELKQAMEDVYKTIKASGKQGVVVLLSDGGIVDTNDVLQLVTRNRSTSVFTIGIGTSVSQALIQGMADAGNGKAEFINNANDGIKEKMMAQLQRAQTNLRKAADKNEIKIDVDGPYKLVPENIPTLYERDINTFFAFSQNPIKEVTYVQNLKDYQVTNVMPFTVVEDETYPLHRMAGIKLIDCLANTPNGSGLEHLKQDLSKNEIITTSLDLGVLSNYTSFIGVEYREDKDKTTQQAEVREIPLQITKGWGYGPTVCMTVECCAAAACAPMSRSAGLKYGMELGPEDCDDCNMNGLFDNDEEMGDDGMFGGGPQSSLAVQSYVEECGEQIATKPAPKKDYPIVLTLTTLSEYTKIGNLLTSKAPAPNFVNTINRITHARNSDIVIHFQISIIC